VLLSRRRCLLLAGRRLQVPQFQLIQEELVELLAIYGQELLGFLVRQHAFLHQLRHSLLRVVHLG